MISCPLNKKIPGELPKSNREKYTKDLSKLEKIELIEIKEREEKLLANKSRILKLPDKGKRIIDFYDKVLKELLQRDEIEKAASLFSELNITSTGESKLNGLEWTGKIQKNFNQNVQILDSDSDEYETDPLKIIAQSRNLVKIKYEKPEISLITQDDVKEIESFSTENSDKTDIEIASIEATDRINSIEKNLLNGSDFSQDESNKSTELEPCALYLFDREVNTSPLKEKFLPYRTTKTNVHNTEKEKLRKIGGKHWENTAATPPSIRNSSAQLLSLSESVDIQIEYLNKLKKLQEKQAAERLAAKDKRATDSQIMLPEESIRKVNKFFASYRNPEDSDSDGLSEEEEEGVRDDAEEKGGFVTYTVYE